MYNHQLDTFLTVVKVGSFNKAAEELFLSPAAIVKQMNSLEANLGVVLFERTKRGLVLTEAGKVLYTDASFIVEYCRDSAQRVLYAQKTGNNIIRVGTYSLSFEKTLTEIWPLVRTILPDVRVKMISFSDDADNDLIIRKALSDNIDISILLSNKELDRKASSESLSLCELPVQCVVPVTHRLAGKVFLTAEDIFGEHLMILKKGINPAMDQIRESIELNYPQINLVDIDNYGLELLNACENRNMLMLGFQPWQNVHPLLQIIPVKWNYSVTVSLCYTTNSSKKVEQLIDAINQIKK